MDMERMVIMSKVCDEKQNLYKISEEKIYTPENSIKDEEPAEYSVKKTGRNI